VSGDAFGHMSGHARDEVPGDQRPHPQHRAQRRNWRWRSSRPGSVTTQDRWPFSRMNVSIATRGTVPLL